MTRVYRREFGSASFGSPVPVNHLLDVQEPITSVAMSPEVDAFFREQMLSPVRVRGGLLFGFREGEILHILLASTPGVPAWYSSTTGAVLNVDSRFALGWSEALISVFGSRIDWVGNWVVHPDEKLKSIERDVNRFRECFASRLVDDKNILVVIGWLDGSIKLRAYNRSFEGTINLLQSDVSKQTLRGFFFS